VFRSVIIYRRKTIGYTTIVLRNITSGGSVTVGYYETIRFLAHSKSAV